MKVSKEAYTKLINQDIDWLINNTESDLERDHIISVLKDSIERIYKKDEILHAECNNNPIGCISSICPETCNAFYHDNESESDKNEEAKKKAFEYDIEHNYTHTHSLSACAHCKYCGEHWECMCEGLGKIKKTDTGWTMYPVVGTCSSFKEGE